MVTGNPFAAGAIEAWIYRHLADDFGLDPASLNPTEPFESFGLASRDIVMLSGDLEDWLGLSLSPVLLYEYPSVRALSEYLAALKAPDDERSKHSPAASASPLSSREPIAIIGMAGRFPGAGDLDSFWQALAEGKDCIGRVPAGRWDADKVAGLLAGKNPLPAWGGFLERVDEFDAAFFGISGREAAQVDPQQRLLLEVTWEALANAGLPVNELAGQAVGVYVGISSSEYGQAQLGQIDQINSYSGTGSALSIAANRLSYYFDWRGPSMALDTACSSSLVAVHLACQSLRSGETRLAVAAGANLILSPAVTVNFNEAGAMAVDGRCKAFDARADGYVRSEGVGVVVLKPLAQAQADGDRIYAVILGSAVNQDGRTNGLMAPNPRSQEEVLLAAYRDAGVSPADISYVEAHGTGTLLGDPIEAKALAAVRQGDKLFSSSAPRLRIGSVKTNVGHLEAAAGVAGLIKVALAIHHRQLPASLHFETPNPHIHFDELPLRVQTALEPWPQTGERAIAGISSFGFGGTNAHVVLASLAEIQPEAGATTFAGGAPANASPTAADDAIQGGESRRLLLLSARTPEALEQTVHHWRDRLAEPVDFEALCYTAAQRQTHLEQRLAVVAGSAGEARELLQAYLAGQADPRLEAGTAPAGRSSKVVFVCPGQGSQWLGMARNLITRLPVFRRSLEETAAAFRAFVDWDLSQLLFAEELPTRIDEIQPALFAVSIALATLWREMGVVPAAVIGHSMGEVAAAHLAGVLSLDDAARVICCRSRLLHQISGSGMMASVDLSAQEAAAHLAGREDQVAVAAVNGPRSVILSGATAAVEAVLVELEKQNIFCRRVKVDVASHSPQVDGLRQPLLELLASIRPQPARLPIYSTVSGEMLRGPEMDAQYWADNLRRPVLFGPVVDRLLDEAFFSFVELSPHPVLLPAIAQVPPAAGQGVVLVASMRRDADEWETILAGLGRLHTHGYPVDWSRPFPHRRPPVSLPPYPWQRERHWFEPAGHAVDVALPGAGVSDHPLLGAHISVAIDDQTHLWQGKLSLQALPFLVDHRVQGQVVFPAAAYLEMALAAGAQYAREASFSLHDVQFDEMLALPDGAAVTAQLVISAEGLRQAAFRISTAGDKREWTRHAQGVIRLGEAAGTLPASPGTPAELQARLVEHVPADTFYAELAARGLQYGPAFRSVAEVWRGEGEALARLSPTEDHGDRYRLHPTLLDGAFQTLAAAMPASTRRATAGQLFLPVSLAALRLSDRPRVAAPLWCFARLEDIPAHDSNSPASLQGDLTLFDSNGNVVAVAEGLRLRAASEAPLAAEDQVIRRWFYRLAWEELPLDLPAGKRRPESWLLFVQPGGWPSDLVEQFVAAGCECVRVAPAATFARLDSTHYQLAAAEPGQFRLLLSAVEASGHVPAGIVYGWGEAANPDKPAAAALQATAGALHLAQALMAAGWRTAPRLYMLLAELAGASLAGLSSTLNHEHPEFRCTTIALGPSDRPAVAKSFVRECLADTSENRIALAGERRYVARLLPFKPAGALAGPRAPELLPGQPVRLRVRQPGILDSLYLAAIERQAPEAGEVEIGVEAAGLNFLDLLSALGSQPDRLSAAPELGLECAGRVTAVGANVEGWRVSDEVIAIAPGAFASFVTARAELVVRKPAALDWAEATTLPIVFMTAYYALRHIGRLQPGERVLIHSAASGTGLAAVQVAQWLGAEIFATAGSEERRAYLRSLGVRHVFGSRTLAFADEIMVLTEGEGVDVVLNSLAGDAIPASLALLRSRGRFLELGKRDIQAHRKLGLYSLRRNLSVSVVDLAGLVAADPAFVGQLLAELLPLFEQGKLRPLPHETFQLNEAGRAFRRMAQARHNGKIVLTPVASERADPKHNGHVLPSQLSIRPDGTYLITGGLGAIGLKLAAFLVQQGARHLLLAGRSEPTAAALADIVALEATGATVHVMRADVASLADLKAVFARFEPQAEANSQPWHPLRGIFHAAGVLDDGVLLQQTAQRFETVMAPKVLGSWNLHRLSLHHPIELFVLFSSAAALVGSPGQANYAAGNAFMDGLARFRQAQGLPALSIQWGPWAEIGLAARPDRAGRLNNRGFDAIRPEQGLRALEWALAEAEPVLAVIDFDARQWRQSYPQAAGLSWLSELDTDGEQGAQPAGGQLRAQLLAAGSAKEQYSILEKHLRQEIASVLRISINRIGPDTALDSLGFDSLLALELRNRLELTLSARLSATLIWNYPTLPAMVAYLASIVIPTETDTLDNGQAISSPPATATASAPDAERAILAEVEMLSDDDALRELVGDGG